MTTRILLSKPDRRFVVLVASVFFMALALVALVFTFASATFVHEVFAASVFDIEFPVKELGNCADKSACKAYCELSENEQACDDFAAKYGLKDDGDEEGDEENSRGDDKEGLEKIVADGGPGNCAAGSQNPERSCHQYCSKQTNMRECISYAKSHGLMQGRELEEAEKVLAALDAGATLPAGCTDEQSCRDTCENPKDVATMRSCFDFAEKAGLLPPGVDRAKAEKMFTLIESGKAPFKSPRDFEKCENPESDEIMDKCIQFAIENDLLSPEEAEMVKKTGGRGPGGCRGKAQCEAFCQTNEEECMKFAEEKGLITEEQKEQMRQNGSRVTESLKNAPEEVRTCLEQAVGAEELNKITSGTSRFGREAAEKIGKCFRMNMGNPDEGRDPSTGGSSHEEEKYSRENFRPEKMMENLSPEERQKFEEMRGQYERGENRPNEKFEDFRGRPEMMQYPRENMNYPPREDMRPPEGTTPPDYRPEGMYPPPESYNRSPEGSYSYPPPGSSESSGSYSQPTSYPESSGSYTPPPPTSDHVDEIRTEAPPPAPAETAPTSRLEITNNNLAAAVMTLLQGFLPSK